jgi:hypothetical protein
VQAQLQSPCKNGCASQFAQLIALQFEQFEQSDGPVIIQLLQFVSPQLQLFAQLPFGPPDSAQLPLLQLPRLLLW